MNITAGTIHERPPLRDRAYVFHDRRDAGHTLAEMLAAFRDGDALILAVPAGGVPVAIAIAENLALPLDVAVVSKITLPWNKEAGYGAVAFNGTVRLNQDIIGRLGLTPATVDEGITATKDKVRKRAAQLRGSEALSILTGRPVILVDDGLASGYTMITALHAVREAGAGEIYVAVPTAHSDAAAEISRRADALFCPNIRQGPYFAVADAYEQWSDVTEREVMAALTALRSCKSPHRRQRIRS